MRLTYTILVVAVVLSMTLSGCAALREEAARQEVLRGFEKRVDVPFEKAYSAAIETLFDLGYTVTHSDKASGILVGEKQKKKTDQDAYDTFQVTLLLKPESETQTIVRIKTAINKEVELDQSAIDEVWLHLERSFYRRPFF